MKRYIRSESNINDILHSIRYFVVIDSVTDCNFGEIYASEDTDDEFYATLPDDKLIQLSDEELESIDNVFALDRIAHIDRSRLTAHQLSLLKNEYKKKINIDDEARETLLELFRECDKVSIANRFKNNEFMTRYDLDEKDVLAILHNLKLSDFDKSTRSMNYGHLGNNLIILKPQVLIPTEDTMIGVKLCVKLDVDYEDKSCAAFVSIHPEGEA